MDKKAIQFVKRERVWEQRTLTWTEEHIKSLIRALESFEADTPYSQDRRAEAEFLKQFTWEQIYHYVVEETTEENQPVLTYPSHGQCNPYKTTLRDLVRDNMREELYDTSADETFYDCDDYKDEEEWSEGFDENDPWEDDVDGKC